MRTTFAALLLLAACGRDSAQPPLEPEALSFAHRADVPQLSDWSAPINVGPPVNTAFAEQNPFISRDGLSLYFDCGNCPGNVPTPGGAPSRDIYVSRRASVDDAWGTPENLTALNTPSAEGGPSLSRDGHRLYFFSFRPEGLGGGDLYVSRRRDKRDDFGWEPPVNLGGAVNTTFAEVAPEIFVDGETGTVTLYFQSDRPGLGSTDIYASTLNEDDEDETFGPAVLVEELSTPFRDLTPAIRRDGLEIFLASNRPGSLGEGVQGVDLWVSTRASTSDTWSAPVNLGPTVNSEFIDQSPALSFDGTELYFTSPLRSGNVGGRMFDLWVATRSKLKGADDEDDDDEDK